MRKTSKQRKPRVRQILRLPRREGSSVEKFRGAVCGVKFNLSLTRPMLEFLCSLNRGTSWDKTTFGSPTRFVRTMTTVAALEERGMISRNDAKYTKALSKDKGDSLAFWDAWEVTDIGRRVVDLLFISGIFVKTSSPTRRHTG